MFTRLKLLLMACLGLVVIRAWANKTPESGATRIDTGHGSSVSLWLESSLKRVFPSSPPGSTNLHLLAARNSKLSFQVAFRNDRIQPLNIECQVTGADDLKPQMRFVGLAPLPHLTPDTELPELDLAGHLPESRLWLRVTSKPGDPSQR